MLVNGSIRLLVQFMVSPIAEPLSGLDSKYLPSSVTFAVGSQFSYEKNRSLIDVLFCIFQPASYSFSWPMCCCSRGSSCLPAASSWPSSTPWAGASATLTRSAGTRGRSTSILFTSCFLLVSSPYRSYRAAPKGIFLFVTAPTAIKASSCNQGKPFWANFKI